MLDLSTTYLGLNLKNPLVPSSTPLSHDIDAVLHLIERLEGARVLEPAHRLLNLLLGLGALLRYQFQ